MKKAKLIPYQEILNELYPTQQDKKARKKRIAAFRKENRMEIMLETANKVKRARKEARITQAELARRLNTNKSVISRIEAGKQNVSVTYLVKVAKALNMRYEIRIYQ